MANSPRNSLGNVRSDMDIAYPEHLSRLNRHLGMDSSKHLTKSRRNNRPRNRYRTQPVTFDEIQEVDEENSILDNDDSDVTPLSSSLQSKLELEDLFQISKALGSKRRKAKATDPAKPVPNSALDQVNGEQSTKSKSMDQLRRTDHGREGSI